MTSIADSAVLNQTSSVSVPSPPSWFGEVVLIAAHLRQHGVLSKISERVLFGGVDPGTSRSPAHALSR